jgi:hypothetical protein
MEFRLILCSALSSPHVRKIFKVGGEFSERSGEIAALTGSDNDNAYQRRHRNENVTLLIRPTSRHCRSRLAACYLYNGLPAR